MSQQGGNPIGHEDDWWGQLYDDSTDDTGPTAAPDSLDDRFASAAGTVGDGSAVSMPGAGSPPGRPASGVAVPRPRAGAAPTGGAERHRAPWEPPPAAPPPPATFPPGPMPPGFTDQPSSTTGAARTSTQPPATTTPTSRAPQDTPPAPQDTRRTDAPPTPTGTESGPPAPTRPGTATESARPTPRHGTEPPSEPPPSRAPAEIPKPPRPTHPGADPHPAPRPAGPGAESAATATRSDLPTTPPPPLDYVGSGPPTYDAEPTALPPADPDELDDLVADTVLDGAHYGACLLRAVSVRGDSARYRGEPRRDSLLTARFGSGEQALVLVAMATGARATPGAHRAAAEACHWIGRAVGRSHARLSEDIRAARRGDLKSGLHRLTDRSLGKLRAGAAEQGIDPDEYAATLRCLLLPADPECRTRVFFGVGAGGLFRLRDGEWHDIEPPVGDITGEPVVGFGSLPHETPEGDRLTMDLGIPTPPSPYEPAPEPPRDPFRFRACVARPGDTLLMCTGGLAEPLRGEPELCEYLTGRWSGPTPPGLAAFLADTQTRVKGYADDRTAAAVWEA
ncbi:PP2C family serine/threonine-protein phosphatase [Streptomyces blattellae]|uniref:PP2C family serine/threonine-protein phosphatase n=1 Tax=Streptomyces blattellae TaxID=2569855 RepID=UPI0012B7E772|nr:PP2C family serine/threonine-protein phosphatase [Streptomyces blattellae]